MRDHRLHGRRDEERKGGLARGDIGKPQARLEAPVHRNFRAGKQCREGLVVESPDVEHRKRGKDVVVLPQVMGMDRIESVPKQGGLGQHDAFRRTGGSRGVDDQDLVAVVPGDKRVGIGQDCIQAEARIHRQTCDVILKFGFEEKDFGAAIGEDCAMLVRRQPPVEGHQQGAQPRGGKQQHQHFRVVVAEIRRCGRLSRCQGRPSRASRAPCAPTVERRRGHRPGSGGRSWRARAAPSVR